MPINCALMKVMPQSSFQRYVCAVVISTLFGVALPSTAGAADLGRTIAAVQPKVAKIYGAGGSRGMEAYQTGFLISPEGHLCTVWSYVLAGEYMTVVLHDGRRYDAELLGVVPLSDIAVLKIEYEGEPLPYFDLRTAAAVEAGDRVLAISNLFGIATGSEAASAQLGVLSAIAPLEARRGAFDARFRGDAYILDIPTNNPGAAGGVLVDWDGRLLGILGKEFRSRVTNTWLNYALPQEAFAEIVLDIVQGRLVSRPTNQFQRPEKPIDPESLGIVLVPSVVARTPPFIDAVLTDSPAARAGLLPDDLIVLVGDSLISSCAELRDDLGRFERGVEVSVTVLRRSELIQVTLQELRSELNWK